MKKFSYMLLGMLVTASLIGCGAKDVKTNAVAETSSIESIASSVAETPEEIEQSPDMMETAEVLTPDDMTEAEESAEESTEAAELAPEFLYCTKEEMLEHTGLILTAPSKSDNIIYNVKNTDAGSAAMISFTYEGHPYEYYAMSTSKVDGPENMSGFDIKDLDHTDKEVGYCTGLGYESEDGEKAVMWLDVAPGISYTLVCREEVELNSLFDVANKVFTRTQDDVEADKITKADMRIFLKNTDINTETMEIKLMEAVPIELTEEYVTSLKEGDKIELGDGGTVDVVLITRNEDGSVYVNDEFTLFKNGDTYNIMGYDDFIYCNYVERGYGIITDDTEFIDEMSKVAYGDANKYSNIVDCLNAYEMAFADISINDGYITSITVEYRP